MNKVEYIERYGIEAYERKLTSARESKRKRLERDPNLRTNLSAASQESKRKRLERDPDYRSKLSAATKESKRRRLEREPDYRLTLNKQFKERYWNDIEFHNYHIEASKNYKKSDEQKLREKEYKMNDVNEFGIPKKNIRSRSYKILIYQRHHTKLKDYQIHHCFGYDDPSKFIYIPRTLHKAIHRFLKENNINADTDHYKYISAIINECTEYTYISA